MARKLKLVTADEPAAPVAPVSGSLVHIFVTGHVSKGLAVLEIRSDAHSLSLVMSPGELRALAADLVTGAGVIEDQAIVGV